MQATIRSITASVTALALVALSGCARAPSCSAIEDAVSADLREQVAQLGNSPLAQLSGESRELQELAANQQLRVKVVDQKCTRIGEDQYRCDVLLDLRGVGELLDPAQGAGAAGDSEKQAVYVLTKLGGKWRAREEPG
jgi:hypothetical protein